MSVSWGIIGCGKISRDFVVALQKHTPGAKVVAVAARDAKLAAGFAAELGIPTAHATYEALAADPAVQAVYIGTIHPCHKEQALLCLRAGKHVLVEKPAALCAADWEEMARCAAEHKRFLMEALWTRFFPAVAAAREAIARGEIGEVVGCTVQFGFNDRANTPRLRQKQLGGGALLDVGVYCLHVAAVAFGSATPSSVAPTALVEGGVDVHGGAVLRYGEKQLALLSWSFLADLPGAAQIHGTAGRIELGPIFHAPEALTVTRPGSEPEVRAFPLPAAGDGERYNFRNGQGMGFEARAVQAAILAGKLECEECPWAETLAVLKTMDEIRASTGVVY